MQLANRTATTLLSSLFFKPNLLTCSLDSTLNYHTMPAPVIAVCHGGGPMPILGDPGHAQLIKSMSTTVPKILGLGTANAPRAIVLVTAHWSATRPTISNGSRHKLYYDYGGFPPEAYSVKYDAPGSPEVAQEVFEVLNKAGLKPRMDGERGWDHGVFVPMTLINPRADIPIVQLSVLTSASPAQHFAMGRALASLRVSNVAILGSGMATFHNLRMMFSGALNDGAVQKRNKQWSETLTETLKIKNNVEREESFEGWRGWVGAKEAHPQGGEEHFMPLLVCAGAGGDKSAEDFQDEIMDMKQSTYYWT
ncbi:Extradiol ring-cleavage dioxygenase, class III enzyme, subunit B [Calycina marina]|uniref:Extradiol ring-cleavage dioxygenase, class III enzyme, subunit B n=1 Tax=Calycina marina TaxID=1763456 RepID=A0A9P7Z146_9HELO|nr:Extradiol ring-cleavage dioxygenase, class III enzyme, subunit B [Calycina marina]